MPNLSTVARHERSRSRDRFECCKLPPSSGRTRNPFGCRFSGSHLRYPDAMRATAIVQGKVVGFKLSPSLARAHRKNRTRR